jgi:hypothetical protein
MAKRPDQGGGRSKRGGFRTNRTDSSHTSLESNTQPAPPQTVASTIRNGRLQTAGGRRDIMCNGKEPTQCICLMPSATLGTVSDVEATT